MRYLFVAKGGDDPTTRYRVEPLIRLLSENGHVCVLADSEQSFPGKISLLRQARSADVVILQRKLFTRAFLTVLAACSRRLVFDFDDAVFVRSDGSPSATRSTRFRAVLNRADLVLAGNGHLQETCAGLVRSVLVPTAVDRSRYETGTEKHDRITLVWIGSSSTRKYLEGLSDVLTRLHEVYPDTRLKVIADFQFRHPHIEVVNVPWSADSEVGELQRSHIGIAPLRDDPWTRGKCALKVIQYMAVGIPVVASDVGANRDVVVPDVTGYLVSESDSWVDALKRLHDSNLRSELGRSARDRFLSRYSQDVVIPKAAQLLMDLSG